MISFNVYSHKRWFNQKHKCKINCHFKHNKPNQNKIPIYMNIFRDILSLCLLLLQKINNALLFLTATCNILVIIRPKRTNEEQRMHEISVLLIYFFRRKYISAYETNVWSCHTYFVDGLYTRQPLSQAKNIMTHWACWRTHDSLMVWRLFSASSLPTPVLMLNLTLKNKRTWILES